MDTSKSRERDRFWRRRSTTTQTYSQPPLTNHPAPSSSAASKVVAFASNRRRRTNDRAVPTNLRLVLVTGLLLLGTLGLAAKLINLQFIQGKALKKQAQLQQQFLYQPFAPRRTIVDRNGDALALDRQLYTLFAHPVMFKVSTAGASAKAEMAAKLSPILNRPVADLVKVFEQAPTGIPVARGLTEDIKDQIHHLWVDGLELIPYQERFYPQQALFGEVVGFVNQEYQGQAGLEFSQQDLLQHAVPEIQLSQTGAGRVIPNRVPTGLFRTDDLRLQLTLDSRLQRVAREALHQQLQKYGAKRGTVIVMDARDGALLALVSEPTYNPNQYYRADLSLFKNWALTDLYEPGSTFKPINVAIALEAGAIATNSGFYDEGRISVGGWPIENFDYSSRGARGPVTVTEILQYSSNVGMVHIMNRVKPNDYYTWLERLGLGHEIGIDLPFAMTGYLKPRSTFVEYGIEPATTAFGQGFSLTPVQLAQIHGTLANGGQLVTPHVIRNIVNPKGEITGQQPRHPAPKRVFSPKTTQAVLDMMETVVDKGTGKPAQIKGYRIGGKTGTAQKANPHGGYLSHAKITSFVSILPIDAPRYVVAAVIDEPQGDNAFGSTVAAPIVKRVMEGLITIEGIPPSRSQVP